MPEVNRRRFLQLAGGTAAFTALSNSIERAAALPAHHSSGTIEDVEHIVVLMQENRSFDHYFGSLRGVRGFGDPRPAAQANGKPVWNQSDGAKDVLPFHPDADDLGLQFIQDLPHGWSDGHSAFNQGKYDKWVPAKSATTMAYLTRDDIPFHYALADSFTICDAYHCSFIGSTDPNRYYLWTGYTGNDGKGGGPVLGNEEAGYSWTTYPERLEAAGVSWKIYQDVGDGLDANGSWGWIPDAYRGNYGDNSLLYFDQYRNAKPGDPLYDKARTGTDARKGEGFFDQLTADVKGGKLPEISWIVAPRPSPSTPTGPRTTVPGTSPRSWTRSPPTPRCGRRPRCSSPTTRTTASSTTWCRRSRRSPPRRASPRSTSARTSSRVTRATPPDRTGSASGCRCSSSRPGARAVTSAPRPSTTPRSSGSWSAASACTSPTSRPGGARSAAI
uniref:phospholipase C n=1 Tax=Streptomyces avermitilis TaxID=33903 RepID=A0A499VSK9_STRAX|nr:hypothetical protein SAVMC3_20460 [Streptomyces avermitilis]